MKAIFQFLIGAILAISALSSSADPQWYNDVYPTNSNSQISLVNQSGGTVTAIRNPTAASVQLNTNTSTRVPSVLVQASATLPVVTIGTTCDPAKETAALSASDRLTILVCPPTGLWTISNRTRLRTATEGSSCDPVVDGNLAVDSAGVTLSCQSSVWKRLGATTFSRTGCYWHNDTSTCYNQCPSGHYGAGVATFNSAPGCGVSSIKAVPLCCPG